MLTQKRLKDVLSYNADTGAFIWLIHKNSFGGVVKPGEFAKNVSVWGYARIGIDGKRYMAHRLAWFYVYGEWPNDQIDHINRNRSDNRLCNLRLSSQGENMQNITLPSHNTSGHKGISWDRQRQKWFAKIQHDRKQIPLGRFDVIDEAIKAYAEAKTKYHSFHPEAA